MLPNEGPAPSVPAQVLHSITRRRHRFYGLIGVAFVLLAAAVWVYGGFETGIDYFTSPPRPPPEHIPVPNHGATGNHGATDANGANGVNGVNGANDATTTLSAPTQTQTHTHTDADPAHDTSTTTDDWRHSNQSPAASVTPGIPTKIWQILLPKKPDDKKWTADPKALEDTASWLAMNTDYT
jgi:alpha 1,6-mannosyltransferase